jgi:hypothetical protein
MFRQIIAYQEKILTPVRTLGVVDGTLYLLSRLVSVISRDSCSLLRYYFVAQPLKRVVSDKKVARPSDILIRRVFPDDPVVPRLLRPMPVLEDRFRQGATCFLATKGPDIVGFIWIIFDKYKEDEVRCLYKMLPQGKAAWDFDVYVDPRYRLGRSFVRLWDVAVTFLAEHGYEASLSRISAFNERSLKSHSSMGAVRIGSAMFLKIGRWQVMLSDLNPYIHFSFSEGSFPTFHLTVPAASLVAAQTK